jgi:hypothetical protein
MFIIYSHTLMCIGWFLATVSNGSVHGYGTLKFSRDAFVCDSRRLLELLLDRKAICSIASPTDCDTW